MRYAVREGLAQSLLALLFLSIASTLVGCGDDDGGDNSVPPAQTVDTTYWWESTTATPPVTATSSDRPTFSVNNPYYEVYVKEGSGSSVQQELVSQVCQGGGCVRRNPHTIMSYTMSSDGNGGYIPIEIRVQSLEWETTDGTGWNIRPSYLQDVPNQKVQNVDTSFMAQGILVFTVTEPCQLSVEIGDEDILFWTESQSWRFHALFLALNPPETEFPNNVRMPTATENNGVWECTSSDPSRSCIVAENDTDCSNLQVPADTDLYITSRGGTYRYYTWGTSEGCGVTEIKTIQPLAGARVFLDQDVIAFARIGNTANNIGVYGYGILSNFFMYGTKDESIFGMIRVGSQGTIWGPITMDSPHRNIRGNANCEVAWTKSFAWVSETDGVELSQTGGHVHDNFFKVNDDVLKAFQPSTTFERNVVWHQYIGRALILSWGNAGENSRDSDGTLKVYDTTIIHDYAGFRGGSLSNGNPVIISTQARSLGFPSLFAILHSMNNDIGTSASAVDIKNFRVEGRVGQLMNVVNGYKQLTGFASWQASNGCTGSVNVNIEGFDLSRVTGFRATSIVGGCLVDQTDPSILNADCLCTTALSCAATDCSVAMTFSNIQNPTADGVPDFVNRLLIGNNTVVTGLQAPAIGV